MGGFGSCPEDKPQKQPGIMAFAQLGMMNAICLGLGMVLGWLVDRGLGTTPVFLFVGMAAGIACGAMVTRAEIKKYQ